MVIINLLSTARQMKKFSKYFFYIFSLVFCFDSFWIVNKNGNLFFFFYFKMYTLNTFVYVYFICLQMNAFFFTEYSICFFFSLFVIKITKRLVTIIMFLSLFQYLYNQNANVFPILLLKFLMLNNSWYFFCG